MLLFKLLMTWPLFLVSLGGFVSLSLARERMFMLGPIWFLVPAAAQFVLISTVYPDHNTLLHVFAWVNVGFALISVGIIAFLIWFGRSFRN